jgi:Carbohydrate family 9 binding domain-like
MRTHGLCICVVALLLMDVSESTAQIVTSLSAQPGAECMSVLDTAVAVKLQGSLGKDGLPSTDAWSFARPVLFCSDWQGNNSDRERQTEVRMIWSPANLFVRFRAKYRDLYTFADHGIRRDQLWTRDVAEVFIQPNSESGHTYKEIEVSPNEDWLDLALTNGKGTDLNCKMKTRVVIDEKEKIWIAELAIPMQCLTREFDPKANWRVNFFRVEGPEPNRFYSAWQPTKTSTPNFHVPEAFGVLQFSSN